MKSRIINYFAIVYILSWLMWWPSIMNAQGKNISDIFLLIGLFANFIPSLVGILLIKAEKGKGFTQYIQEKMRINFSRKWLAFFLIFPLQSGITLFLVKMFEKGFSIVNPIPPAMIPLVFLQILIVGGALGEEFGWRGYAYGHLESKFGPFLGTLILGVLWSVWHLPLFFIPGTVQSYLPIWQFMLQNTILAYFYTWVYRKTNGNLTLMILLHAIMNTSAAIFPYWQSNLGRYIGLAMLVFILLVMVTLDKLNSAKKALS